MTLTNRIRFFTLVALFTCLIFCNARAEELPYLTHAKKVADISAWNLWTYDYRWISEEEIFYFHLTDGEDDWIIAHRNIKEDKETTMKTVSNAFRRSMGDGGDAYLAPDGKHFMWTSPWAEFYIASLDDKIVSKTDSIADVYWVDGQHWIELIHQEGMRFSVLNPPAPIIKAEVHAIGKAEPIRTLSIAEDDPFNVERAKIGIQRQSEFVTPDYRLLYANWDERENVSTQIITETPLLKKGASRRIKVKIPLQTAVDDIRLLA